MKVSINTNDDKLDRSFKDRLVTVPGFRYLNSFKPINGSWFSINGEREEDLNIWNFDY